MYMYIVFSDPEPETIWDDDGRYSFVLLYGDCLTTMVPEDDLSGLTWVRNHGIHNVVLNYNSQLPVDNWPVGRVQFASRASDVVSLEP